MKDASLKLIEEGMPQEGVSFPLNEIAKLTDSQKKLLEADVRNETRSWEEELGIEFISVKWKDDDIGSVQNNFIVWSISNPLPLNEPINVSVVVDNKANLLTDKLNNKEVLTNDWTEYQIVREVDSQIENMFKTKNPELEEETVLVQLPVNTQTQTQVIQEPIQEAKALKLDALSKDIKTSRFNHMIKTFVWEALRFSMVFSILFILIVVFINFNVFYYTLKDMMVGTQTMAWDINIQENNGFNAQQLNSKNEVQLIISNNEDYLSDVKEEDIASSDNFELLKRQKMVEALDSTLWELETKQEKTLYDRHLSAYLQWKVKLYSFDFNLLPSDNRILAPEYDINSPVIDVPYLSAEKLDKADYDAELYNGVVKYPYTPDPDQVGNILIFGHTSYYWWKKNEYGQIFSKIHKFKQWDTIKLVRNWRLYEYEFVEKVIKWPSKVWEVYDKYKNWKYLTLMWCYPIWTDSQRILVILKQIDKSNVKMIVNDESLENNKLQWN